MRKKRTIEPRGSEYERLTDELIQQTTGESGLLRQQLSQMLSIYSAENNPLGVAEAKDILKSLIKLAIAQRRLLAGRIEKSIESGGMFDIYYGEMQAINKLSVDAHASMKEMQYAREMYQFQRSIYETATGKAYRVDYRTEVAESTTISAQQDIWMELSEEGGKSDEAFDDEVEDTNK